MNPAPSVSQSVSLSVRLSVTKNSHTSHHYFFLKHCMKLDHYKCRKVTKPDFPGKLSNFFYKQFFKKSVFGHFLENASLLLAEIAYLDSSQHYLQVFYWHHGQENSYSPIFGLFYKQFFKKSVFGHFLENPALALAKITYTDNSQHYLQLFYWHHGRENSSSPIFQQKLRFLIKKIHYLPISRKILLLQGSNPPVMFIRWLSTTFLLTPCLGKADFLIWLPSICEKCYFL